MRITIWVSFFIKIKQNFYKITALKQQDNLVYGSSTHMVALGKFHICYFFTTLMTSWLCRQTTSTCLPFRSTQGSRSTRNTSLQFLGCFFIIYHQALTYSSYLWLKKTFKKRIACRICWMSKEKKPTSMRSPRGWQHIANSTDQSQLLFQVR